MYCGNCLRDNALVAELRRRGHDVTMVPLYLPLTLDERDESTGTPIFFSGINVYLEQKSGLFRKSPQWFRRLMRSRGLLSWAAGRAAKTRAEDVGELTLSMLRGEEGNQNRDLTELITWLKEHAKPDIICLSNVLLVGMARRLKRELDAAVVCMLQGEDWFLDALPSSIRAECWRTVAERTAETDLLIASSHYFGELMARRLSLPPGKVAVAWNGIHLEGFAPGPKTTTSPPTVGFFARLSPEKGLDTLVDAYILLRREPRNASVRLLLGGSCGPADKPFLQSQLEKLQAAGITDSVEVRPNLSREEKIAFLKSLSVFSVPARYGEAFGLYVVEALACGVPVVQPNTASYPEIIAATEGGLLFEPENAESLAANIQDLLDNPAKRQTLGKSGRETAIKRFSSEAMADSILALYEKARTRKLVPA
jgi:glycosyltransferase involved in cell wall biosynthesis